MVLILKACSIVLLFSGYYEEIDESQLRFIWNNIVFK